MKCLRVTFDARMKLVGILDNDVVFDFHLGF